MSHSIRVSARSFLIAGMSAAVVGTAAVAPVSPPAPPPAKIAAAVQLASLETGVAGIIDNLEAVRHTIEVAIGNLTGGIANTINGLTVAIRTAIDNLTSGVANTINGLGLTVTATVQNLAAGLEGIFTSLSGNFENLQELTAGVKAGIKKSYDGVSRWPAYAVDMAQFSATLIPGLWWFAPGISYGYRVAEPLIRAGVYSFADLVGLDFAQFARDISEGLNASASNAVTYAKAWLDSLVPVPPLPPYPVFPGVLAQELDAPVVAAAAVAPPAVAAADTPAGGTAAAGATATLTTAPAAPSEGSQSAPDAVSTTETATPLATVDDTPPSESPAQGDKAAAAAEPTEASTESPEPTVEPAAPDLESSTAAAPTADVSGAPADAPTRVRTPHRSRAAATNDGSAADNAGAAKTRRAPR